MNEQLNNILEQQLRDAHTPDAISWWPLAIGWWVLIALIVGLSVFTLIRFLKNRKINVYRKLASQELNRQFMVWQDKQNASDYLQAANAIIKRAYLHISNESAGLSGAAWVSLLNTHTRVELSAETADALTGQLYQKSPTVDISRVHNEINSWLRNHSAQPNIQITRSSNA